MPLALLAAKLCPAGHQAVSFEFLKHGLGFGSGLRLGFRAYGV